MVEARGSFSGARVPRRQRGRGRVLTATYVSGGQHDDPGRRRRRRPETVKHWQHPVVTAPAGEHVDDVRKRLTGYRGDRRAIDAIAVVDDDGVFVTDVAIFELATAAPKTPLGELAAPVPSSVVTVEQDLSEAVWALLDSGRQSIVVVDGDGRPVGRLVAASLIKHLQRRRWRRWSRAW